MKYKLNPSAGNNFSTVSEKAKTDEKISLGHKHLNNQFIVIGHQQILQLPSGNVSGGPIIIYREPFRWVCRGGRICERPDGCTRSVIQRHAASMHEACVVGQDVQAGKLSKGAIVRKAGLKNCR